VQSRDAFANPSVKLRLNCGGFRGIAKALVGCPFLTAMKIYRPLDSSEREELKLDKEDQETRWRGKKPTRDVQYC